MDIKTLIPVLIAVVSALAGLLVWVFQRRVEAKEREKLRKEELYTQLLESLVSMSSFGESAPFLVESQRSWLYASDEVIKKINAYIEALFTNAKPGKPTGEQDRKKIQHAEYELRLAIRQDMAPNTGITIDWMRSNWISVGTEKESYAEYISRRK